MKVIIHVYGEGDFKRDTLPAHVVPSMCKRVKAGFEKNGVPTTLIVDDEEAPKE